MNEQVLQLTVNAITIFSTKKLSISVRLEIGNNNRIERDDLLSQYRSNPCNAWWISNSVHFDQKENDSEGDKV